MQIVTWVHVQEGSSLAPVLIVSHVLLPSDMCSSPRNYPLPPHRPWTIIYCLSAEWPLLWLNEVQAVVAGPSRTPGVRNIPVVQWLRLLASTAGDMCSFLSQGARTPHATWCGQKKRSRMPHVLASAACLLGSSTCCLWWDPAGVLSPGHCCTSPCY